ncbi:MAG: UDP-2,3-diacylglucosamine diphosphatase [Bacteroidetes bacterium]|nr:UDP-2,3-diacylglucosamine diphosphatase [Bacteroidota bacterium]MDA0904126.1 UDP-2,3-diacylglucosamine diphosphatase [Bacteroidota bacterium]MDA1242650.1 UDP-2,3-diacylglucosamine diphosphatase [Bacteroidota bacterium]
MTLQEQPLLKRPVEVAVISDLHLGMRGCRATEVLRYLKSIDPEILVLNGDIIDVWQFKKKYFPAAHMQVVRELLGMIAKQKTIYYVTGNHDEVFRRFKGFETSNFRIVNKVVLPLDGKKAWFFHGDVFDVTMQHSKWLAMLGGKGYDALIWFNHLINQMSLALGKGRISLSKKVKESVKSAVKFINHFEETAAEIAIRNGFEYVVCGHIHQPANRIVKTDDGEVTYLNSGDWVENCTALEYNQGEWRIHWQEEVAARENTDEVKARSTKDLFQELLVEFSMI